METIGRSSSRRVLTATATGVLLLLVATVVVTRLATQTDAASLVAAQSRSSAITALEDQFVALGAADDSAVDRLFVGAALDEMRVGLRAHIRKMVIDQTTYPGKRTLSNVQFLSVGGDYATTMTMDIRAHVKQADMLGDRIEGYSEGDVDFHIVMMRDGAAWKVSDLDWDWAPGFSP